MNKHDADRELELGRFGEYLLKSRVMPEKYAPYYVRWVRKFMVQVPDRPGLGFEDTLSVFLNSSGVSPSVGGGHTLPMTLQVPPSTGQLEQCLSWGNSRPIKRPFIDTLIWHP